MRRRDFIKGIVGSAVTWPLAARAQQASMPVVGFLRPSRADEAGHLFAAVRQGLRESGYPSDKITIEARWADDQAERLPSLASELVNLQVSAIVGSVRAARRIHPLPGRGGQWRVDGADQMNDTGATLQQKQREVGKLLAGLCLVDRREQQVITAKANKQ